VMIMMLLFIFQKHIIFIKLLQVEFDDGDVAENLPRQKVCTVRQFQQEFGLDVPLTAKASIPATVLSPREMYAHRCKRCDLCIKLDCGSCLSCMNNKRTSSKNEREICLQKVRG
jgi:hypothetical protein